MSIKTRILLLFIPIVFFLAGNTSWGQTTISGIINDYTKVTTVTPSCNSVTVTNTTGFAIGGKVLLIQMKGATVSGTNNNAFGTITAYGNAGNYEFNEIYDIQGLVIYLKHTLLKTYDPIGLQLITIPNYGNVDIIGTLTASQWDGNTGGVLVFESSGTVTFNADINVEGLGFRGGARSTNAITTCGYFTGTYYTTLNTNGFAAKGESISEYIAGREAAQANQANGGGGGHSNNSGGGGGSNYGLGGYGGRQAYRSTGGSCNGSGVGARGIGGVTLSSNYSNALNKIFMGGGGGGGHQNNLTGSGPPNLPGGTQGNPGGGIVIIKATEIVGNSHKILADGFNNRSLNASSLVGFAGGTKRAYGDAGGGGGGGGSVLLEVSSFASSPLSIDVSGGRGDSSYTEVLIDLGPGGGGGGGVVWVNNASLDPNVSAITTGGVTGISWNPGYPTEVCQCSNNSTPGNPGTILTNLVIPKNNIVFPPCSVVPVELISYYGLAKPTGIALNWTTVSETNNSYFTLEKSTDGVNYTYMSSIQGHINSQVVNNYSFQDLRPSIGINYYTLKQFDLDGAMHSLGTIKVLFNGSNAIIERIYPNPFNSDLTIELSEVSNKDSYSIKITDVCGAEITSSTIQTSERIFKLDLGNLKKGVYFIQITSNKGSEIRKIIKE